MENDLIRRSDALAAFAESTSAMPEKQGRRRIEEIPAVDAVEIPETGIGNLSDGYHTFNDLYHQRAVLFAALVKVHKDRAWKSWRHSDGELPFGKEDYFVVGIDTPEGSYTYHYHGEYWDMFECVELPRGKEWDGHTDKDVTRLLSLPVDAVEEKQGFWKVAGTGHPKPGNQRYRKQDQWTVYKCSNCEASNGRNRSDPYCRHCGARMLVDNCRYCYNGARMDGEEEHNALD